MRLLPKSIHRCRRYPTKFNSGRDIPEIRAESCWSKTIRTARSFISGEYLLRLVMTPSSQELESPGNPGRFTSWLDFVFVLSNAIKGFSRSLEPFQFPTKIAADLAHFPRECKMRCA